MSTETSSINIDCTVFHALVVSIAELTATYGLHMTRNIDQHNRAGSNKPGINDRLSHKPEMRWSHAHFFVYIRKRDSLNLVFMSRYLRGMKQFSMWLTIDLCDLSQTGKIFVSITNFSTNHRAYYNQIVSGKRT